MHRSVSAVVTCPQIQADLAEKVKTDGLIALSSHVHRADAHEVDCKFVGSIGQQKFTQGGITFEGSEVKRYETLLYRLRVHKGG